MQSQALYALAACLMLAAAPAAAQGYYNAVEDLAASMSDGPAAEAEADAAAAQAQEAPPAQGQRHVVTSVKKCYEEIGLEAAMQIRKSSLTPYADCQKMLRAQEAKKAAAAKAEEEAPAENYRNYSRVTEKKAPPEAQDGEEAAAPSEEEEAAARRSQLKDAAKAEAEAKREMLRRLKPEAPAAAPERKRVAPDPYNK